ncbi:MAG: hypothetical protein IK078_05710 [Lachnospiraceae bacterium]|nr:hypothetical protein [Lachnospiraceae bacterium]
MSDVIYDLLYILPISVIAASFVVPFFETPENEIVKYACFGAGLLLALWYKHVKGGLKLLLPALYLAAGIGIVFIQKPQLRPRFIAEYSGAGLVLITAVLIFAAGSLMTANKQVRRILAAGIFAWLAYVLFTGQEIGKPTVAAALFVLAVVVAEELFRKKAGDNADTLRKYLVSLTPFFALTALILYLSPAPKNPYDWAIFYRIAAGAEATVKTLGRVLSFGHEDYEASIGFTDSDSSSFLAKLRGEREKELMVLSDCQNIGRFVYLTGQIRDEFDGRTWHSSEKADDSDILLDSLETTAAVIRYEPVHQRDLYLRARAKISYENFNTGYFFMPQKTLVRSDLISEKPFEEKDGAIVSKRRLGYGTQYDVIFVRLNRRNEAFEEMLRQAEIPSPPIWEKAKKHFGVSSQTRNPMREDEIFREATYDEYLDYRERIRTDFAPKTPVTERTQTFMDQLLAGAETDYDKLSRIEMCLMEMNYTLSPGAIPKSVDTPAEFLDYFLFEKQEGYCNHFATAFILMARHAGIPARFVQGFRVKRGDDPETVVTSFMAHAWPEAYIDGVGWIPFEPTPGKMVNTNWESSAQEEAIRYQEKQRSSEEESQLWMMPMEDGSMIGFESEEAMQRYQLELEKQKRKEEAALEEGDIEIADGDITVTGSVSGLILRFFAVLFLVVICFFAIFFLGRYLLAKRRFNRMSEREKYLTRCHRNLTVLALLGFEKDQGETLEELGRRVMNTGNPKESDQDRTGTKPAESADMSDQADGGLAFIQGLELLLYAGKDPTDQMQKEAQKDQEILRRRLIQDKGKLKAALLLFSHI